MRKRICFVTNIPAPYREPVHKLVFESLLSDYHVIYASRNEPDREWKIEELEYSRSYLKKGFYIKIKNKFIHFNPDVWSELNKINPQVVITNSYNPTFLLAFFWTLIKKRTHIVMTDGWQGSEVSLSFIHRIVRKIVFKKSLAFIGASRGSMKLFRSYGCDNDAIFQSHLCADNTYYSKFINHEKKYDLVFSGQIIKRKMPSFFVSVADLVQRKISKKIDVLVIGSGPLKEEFLNSLKRMNINTYYPGFVSQKELPSYYASAKILLFPTEEDAWGVVANEACAAGLPVITCGMSGAANDLIIDGKNGYVLPIDKEMWAERIVTLLTDGNLYRKMSEFALKHVKEYSYENAAKGIINAITFATKEGKK